MDFVSSIVSLFAAAPPQCTYGNSSFIGLPYWYQYLPGQVTSTGSCQPTLNSISDIWLIVAGVIEILLRLAAIAAIIMIIYGAVQLISSQGNPTNATKARSTIINSLIGLVIAVIAAAVVSYLGGQFS